MPNRSKTSLPSSRPSPCRVASVLLPCALFAAPSPAAQNAFTLRILPESTFTDNVCNDPCVCIIDPIPYPIGGRIYLAIAPSIPEVPTIAGPFRFSTSHAEPIVLSGSAAYSTVLDPAWLSRLTLDTTHGNQPWLIDSGFFTPVNPPFPTLILDLMTAQNDCTTLHLSLQTVETCVTDFDDGSGKGLPDGGVTIDDLLYFLGAFEQGDAIADIDDGSGMGLPDQAVTIDDLLQFLIHFETGC